MDDTSPPQTGPSAGVVYLVGAGPGDPGLLTRRGAELVARADVVCFDRLVHPGVLALARPQAELVDVGKRPGESGRSQERINELLVARAREGKRVVRLKGGDPFVFGRGGEEAEVLAAAGIRFEVVPGVTSAVAGPAYAGIPLTHREYASWVAVATGHEDPKKARSSLDWTALARAPTAVFLMGLERLGEIAEALCAAGRDPATPAALVASATWPGQRVVLSTLGSVARAATALEPPAVLVVGEVVSLARTIGWWAARPLAGHRVFVTRTRRQAGRLCALLADAGADVVEVPAIATTTPDDPAPLEEALRNLRRFGWVAFTSTNAVDAFWRGLGAAGLDTRVLAGLAVAAVGPATSDALRSRGIEPDLVASTPGAEGLAESFGLAPPARGRARRVLLPQAQDAPDVLERRLRRAGWRPVRVPAYRTVPDRSSVEAGRRALAEGVDALVFTSGSTARSFVELWGRPPPGCVVCCMGAQTAEVARACGLRVDAVARRPTLEDLVAATIEAVRG